MASLISKPGTTGDAKSVQPFGSRKGLVSEIEERRANVTVRLEVSAREQLVVGNYGTHVRALLVRNGPDGAPLPRPLVFIEAGSQHGILSLLDIKDPKNKDFPITWEKMHDVRTYDRDERSRDITAIYIRPEDISKYGIPINPDRPLQLEVAESSKGLSSKG